MKTITIVFLSLVLLISVQFIGFADEEKKQTTESEAKHCLVCGPEAEMESLGFSYKFQGKKYSFCSLDCMKEFKKNPEKYLKQE